MQDISLRTAMLGALNAHCRSAIVVANKMKIEPATGTQFRDWLNSHMHESCEANQEGITIRDDGEIEVRWITGIYSPVITYFCNV